MKRYAFYLVLAFIIVGIVLSGCQRDRGDGRVVLRVGAVMPPEDFSVLAMERMAGIAYEMSGGTMVLQVFPASQLGSGVAQMEAVSIGTQDIFIDSSSFVGTFLRDRQFDSMFFAFRDAEHFTAFMGSDMNRQLEEDFRRQTGIRIIVHNWYRAPRSFVSRVPFDADTFEGLIVRVPDIRGYLESVAAMGGSPTQLAWAEIYLGLMQGVVHAAEGPLDSLYSNRFHEAANNIILTEHIRDSMVVYINDRVWDRLRAYP